MNTRRLIAPAELATSAAVVAAAVPALTAPPAGACPGRASAALGPDADGRGLGLPAGNFTGNQFAPLT
jgi:hypothetical protein